MQVNVQFLQQLQPEWSRFVTVVKQSKEIDTISYHTLFDILKQYQNEVNDIRAERIAKMIMNKLRGIRTCKRIGTPCKDFKRLYKPTTTTIELLQLQDKTEDTTRKYNTTIRSWLFGNPKDNDS
ncbi:hypothetical protein Tco_1482281 [Tanacetum coccineum]